MKIDKNSSITLYKQIEKVIEDKILNFEYRDNEKIENEMTLCETFEVSRSTLRKALDSLVKKGLLIRVKSKGTFVNYPKLSQDFTKKLNSFNSEVFSKKKYPKTDLIALDEILPEEEIRAKLELNDDELVYKVQRLRYIDDIPVVYAITYVPKKICCLKSRDLEKESLYAIIEESGYPCTNVKRTLEIRKANELLSGLLNIGLEEPLFRFKSTSKSKDVPIEYCVTFYRSDVNKFEFEIEK